MGHLLGDVALRKLAGMLENNLRRADVACRYGGEEFVVLLPEIDASHAQIVAEKLRTAIFDVDFEGEDQLPHKRVTISIGVSAFPEHGDDAAVVLRKADEALYEAKRKGRNQVVVVNA